MKNYLAFFALMLLFACGEDVTQTVTKACFDYFPKDDLQAGQPILFANCSENALSYQWDFGDGQNSDAMAPSHTYEKEGSYKVQLIVRGINSVDSLSKIVTIEKKTKACFNYSPTGDIKAGEPIVFTNCSESALSYQWDFGDGQNSDAAVPLHTYEKEGSYKVLLIVKGSNSVDSLSKIVEIRPVDSIKEITIGVNEKNAISIDFSPGFVEDAYYTSAKSVQLGINGVNYLQFSKYFNGPLGTYNYTHYQNVTTLNDCEICTRDSKPAVFKLNDKVSVTDTFMKLNKADLATAMGNNNYLVIRFGNDKKYIGWLNINVTNTRLEFLKCSYYELKNQ